MTVVPEIVQAPAEEPASTVKVTGLPDAPPVADRVAPPPTLPLAGGVNVMAWAACVATTVAEVVAGVAPSAASDSVMLVVNVPLATFTSTVKDADPSVVPGLMGVVAVDVQVRTVFPAERPHVYPAGLPPSAANTSPAGSVAVNDGSSYAGPPVASVDGWTPSEYVEP